MHWVFPSGGTGGGTILFTGIPGTGGTPGVGIPGTGGNPGIGDDRTTIPGGGLIPTLHLLSLTGDGIITVQGILPELAAQPVRGEPATSEEVALDRIHRDTREAAEVSEEITPFLLTAVRT